jgi:hypothetical protein
MKLKKTMKLKYTIAALTATTLAANAASVTTSHATVTGDRDGNQAGPMWGQFVTPEVGASVAGPHGALYLQDFSYQAADNIRNADPTAIVYLHAYTTFSADGSGAINGIGGFTAVSISTVDLGGVADNGTLNWSFGGGDAFDDATAYAFVLSTSASEVTMADTSSMVGTNFALDVGDLYTGGDSIRGNGSASGWDQHFEANFDTNAVPEPSSTVLFGLAGLALIIRRRK